MTKNLAVAAGVLAVTLIASQVWLYVQVRDSAFSGERIREHCRSKRSPAPIIIRLEDAPHVIASRYLRYSGMSAGSYALWKFAVTYHVHLLWTDREKMRAMRYICQG